MLEKKNQLLWFVVIMSTSMALEFVEIDRASLQKQSLFIYAKYFLVISNQLVDWSILFMWLHRPVVDNGLEKKS